MEGDCERWSQNVNLGEGRFEKLKRKLLAPKNQEGININLNIVLYHLTENHIKK